MFKSFCYLFSSVFLILISSCSESENYKTAYGFEKDGKTFIKLKGKRQLAAHDPSSVVSNKTYEDSLIIEVPSLQNSKINGKDIPVRKGYYKYLGEVIVLKTIVKMYLIV